MICTVKYKATMPIVSETRVRASSMGRWRNPSVSSCTATAAIASEIEAGIANRTTLLVKSPLAQLGGFVS